ncbi:MAG: GNAT family N-acetyltransferase [Ilumatobacteraceae bacterium]
MKRHLAQLNIAALRHPIDDPRTADFTDALPAVNGAGERSPGYVWRLQSDGGDATDIQVFDDPLLIVNLTVWESLDALKAFAYRGIHRDFLRRRAEWFVEGSTRTALWWMPAGSLPTTDDAKRRLDFVDVFGTSPYAFEMGQNHPALVIAPVDRDDERAARVIAEFGDDPDQCLVDGHGFVVAEMDDVAVACGAYRKVDTTTAEIMRMYVARSARRMRIGAAMASELESLAATAGAHRLLLETGDQMRPLYEKFGFRAHARRNHRVHSPGSVRMEKALTPEVGRLA